MARKDLDFFCQACLSNLTDKLEFTLSFTAPGIHRSVLPGPHQEAHKHQLITVSHALLMFFYPRLLVEEMEKPLFSATISFASKAGIKVFVTGGIGGVHRQGESRKPKLLALNRTRYKTPVAVVCAGTMQRQLRTWNRPYNRHCMKQRADIAGNFVTPFLLKRVTGGDSLAADGNKSSTLLEQSLLRGSFTLPANKHTIRACRVRGTTFGRGISRVPLDCPCLVYILYWTMANKSQELTSFHCYIVLNFGRGSNYYSREMPWKLDLLLDQERLHENSYPAPFEAAVEGLMELQILHSISPLPSLPSAADFLKLHAYVTRESESDLESPVKLSLEIQTRRKFCSNNPGIFRRIHAHRGTGVHIYPMDHNTYQVCSRSGRGFAPLLEYVVAICAFDGGTILLWNWSKSTLIL
ncbi:hypothetical protein SELMODRAFT_425398 [Selaginella moellendorffii]|uniref:Uncharacterized protein n=1 Tax=Selaginella moellendorffii TaxID=88036 RepID=D8SSZ4_SELML|nr:hypothetical protein SELMODRAFT_425398 [Selaginella moellendorffii]